MTKKYLLLIPLCMLIACSQQEKARETLDFMDEWRFTLADAGDDYSAGEVDTNGWRELNLPHDWSIESDFGEEFPAAPGGGALPGGIGWYRKTFTPDKAWDGKKVYIDFDGVYWNSTVWVNGNLLGHRPNGYVSFRYDLSPFLEYGKENVIAVKVDNTRQPNSRWYSGSGIYRPVRLTVNNPVHIDLWGVYVTTPEVNEARAEANVATTIVGAGDDEVLIKQRLYDGKVCMASVESGETIQSLMVENPILWTLEDPKLYTLITEVYHNDKLADSYETRIGFRYFEFDVDKGFFLNGKHVKLNGVCLHHDQGCLGTAVNYRAIERQLQIMKDMGCNSIRTSHNPPAVELLDLCDSLGFVVMDESFDVWRKPKTKYDYSHYFQEWYERDLTDFMLRDRNHPSVFMWSIGNEVLEQWTHADMDTLSLQQANVLLNKKKEIDPKEYESGEIHVNQLLTQLLYEKAKELDPTRPITAGCNESRPLNHLFKADVLDIIGINYHVFDYDSVQSWYPGKPFLAAETVSSLMTRGYYIMPSDEENIWPAHWTLSFHRDVQQCSSYDNSHVPWGTTHEETWKYVKKNDFVAGQYIWTGFDYLGEPTPYWWPSRSSYFGIVDLCGFPKDVYYMYQSEWTDKNVLHVFPHWNWNEGETIDIWAYYNNADEVELYLNDESLGIKSKEGDDLHVWWRIDYVPGTLKAVARKNGAEVMNKVIVTTGEPVGIRLTADRSDIKADGKDLSYITVEVVDKDGNPVPTADNLIRFTIEGEGIIAGTDNGDPTNPHSLKKPERALFSGKALAVVQSTKTKGNIKLKASSPGLPDKELVIKSL